MSIKIEKHLGNSRIKAEKNTKENSRKNYFNLKINQIYYRYNDYPNCEII